MSTTNYTSLLAQQGILDPEHEAAGLLEYRLRSGHESVCEITLGIWLKKSDGTPKREKAPRTTHRISGEMALLPETLEEVMKVGGEWISLSSLVGEQMLTANQECCDLRIQLAESQRAVALGQVEIDRLIALQTAQDAPPAEAAAAEPA